MSPARSPLEDDGDCISRGCIAHVHAKRLKSADFQLSVTAMVSSPKIFPNAIRCSNGSLENDRAKPLSPPPGRMPTFAYPDDESKAPDGCLNIPAIPMPPPSML